MDCSHLVAQCTEIINLIDSKYSATVVCLRKLLC